MQEEAMGDIPRFEGPARLEILQLQEYPTVPAQIRHACCATPARTILRSWRVPLTLREEFVSTVDPRPWSGEKKVTVIVQYAFVPFTSSSRLGAALHVRDQRSLFPLIDTKHASL